MEDCTTIWDNWATSDFRRVAQSSSRTLGDELRTASSGGRSSRATVAAYTIGAKANGVLLSIYIKPNILKKGFRISISKIEMTGYDDDPYPRLFQ